jgi:hypothetical protein
MPMIYMGSLRQIDTIRSQLRFLQLTFSFSHLQHSADSGLRDRPFRHPLPKLTRPGPQRLGLFLVKIATQAGVGLGESRR